MSEQETIWRIADIAVSLALLVAILVGFVRGDLLSRRSLSEVIAQTVKEVIKEMRGV